MKKIAHKMMVGLILMFSLLGMVFGVIRGQEGDSGGIIVAVVSALLFYAILITKDED